MKTLLNWLLHPVRMSHETWLSWKTTMRYTFMMSDRARVGFRWRKEAVRAHLFNVVKELERDETIPVDSQRAIVVETSIHGMWVTTFDLRHEAEILTDGDLEDHHYSVCYPQWGTDGTFIFVGDGRHVRLPGNLKRMMYDVRHPVTEQFVGWTPREKAFIKEALAGEKEKDKELAERESRLMVNREAVQ